MRVMTDDTAGRYAAAAAALPADTVREVIRKCERHAAHTDDSADALPYALIALADAAASGAILPVSVAVTVALTGARRDRIRRESVVTPTSPDTLPEREVPARESVVTLADALESVPTSDAALLSGVAAQGLERLERERLAAADWKGLTGADRFAALWAPVPLTRRALRVGDVARAVGAPVPHSRAASTALRAAACVAWARVSVLVGPGAVVEHQPGGAVTRTRRAVETVEARAARAMAYVTTDAAALAAAYRRERDLVSGATSSTSSPDTLRRLGWVSPVSDPVSGSLTRSLPEPKKGAPKRSRKGLVTPSTSSAYAGGLEPRTAHGATVSGDRTGATDARAALVEGKRIEREEAAAASHAAHAAAVEQLRPCARPLPAPAATSAAGWWLCGCGATSAALAAVWPVDPTHPVLFAHPLPACPVPLVGADGARCGCGSKRGALVEIDGAHFHRRVSRAKV